jgi:hypothetical protein
MEHWLINSHSCAKYGRPKEKKLYGALPLYGPQQLVLFFRSVGFEEFYDFFVASPLRSFQRRFAIFVLCIEVSTPFSKGGRGDFGVTY